MNMKTQQCSIKYNINYPTGHNTQNLCFDSKLSQPIILYIMNRGQDYEENRYSERNNRYQDDSTHFSHNRPRQFGDRRPYKSEFGYSQNRQNLHPRRNEREIKRYDEPTDYMDFKKYKNNEQPRKFDYKCDQFQMQQQQNCKSTSSYRSEIKPKYLGGYYSEQRVNFDSMDSRIDEYWKKGRKQDQQEETFTYIKEKKQNNLAKNGSVLNKERQRENSRNRANRLEQIQQIVEPTQKTNVVKDISKKEQEQCDWNEQSSQSLNQARVNKQKEGLNSQNQSSSWINQEDILHELSKSSLNNESRKQEVSIIEKQHQDKNPSSYLSSIDAAYSSSGQLKTLSGFGHESKDKKCSRLNIHKLLEEKEGEEEKEEQKQDQEEQDREDIPQLSLIPKQQIISQIQLSNSLEQKDIQIEFICRKNIVQLKIKEVYLVKLKLFAKLIQQRDGNITMVTNPQIDQEVLQQYIHFYQISQSMPRIFQSEPKTVDFKLCKIRVPARQQAKLQKSKELSFIKKSNRPHVNQNKLTLDWQLIRIQKIQLHCMSCNHSNVVPIIHGDLSASLSCKDCSESMEIEIVKVCSE